MDSEEIREKRIKRQNEIQSKIVSHNESLRKQRSLFGGFASHLASPNTEPLPTCSFEWVPCSGGNIPFQAVSFSIDNETVYFGRVLISSGSYAEGYVRQSHGCCYILIDGQEIAFKEYEILVQRDDTSGCIIN